MSGCCVISDAKFNRLAKGMTTIHMSNLASIGDACPNHQFWGGLCKMIFSDVIASTFIN